MFDETPQDQWSRCLGRHRELCRGIDRSDLYCGKIAQEARLLAFAGTCNRCHQAALSRMLLRYPSCVGCSRTFPLMKSRVRRNSCLKRSGEIWSMVGGQVSGSSPRPMKIACQLSEKKDSSSIGAISPRARNVAILCASGCGTCWLRACCQNSPAKGDSA